jgi:hypothetical protein
VVRALNDAGVDYLVVGGVAVGLHGYPRTTQDLDLVLRMGRENVLTALDVLSDLGYRPLLPVDPREFADPTVRRRWVEERNLSVFSMTSDHYRQLTVDLLAGLPFDFDEEMKVAERGEVEEGLAIPLVSIETLIRMKEAAGRPQDLEDVRHLRFVLEAKGPDASATEG